MTLALDFPQCSHAPLGRLDPRWKLAAIFLAILASALQRSLWPTLAAFAGALVLACLARLPLRWYLLRLSGVALVLVLFLGWLPFFHSGPRADLWGFSVSVPGLTLALVLLAKALTVVSLMLALLATAPLQDTFKAAHALHVPGVFIHLVLLTYRFVYLVGEEFARLRIALRVRGFRNRANVHSYRTIGQVAGTLLVRSHERAERVGQAMRCRGFDGTFRSLHDFKTRPADVLGFVLIVGTAAGLLAWDLWRVDL